MNMKNYLFMFLKKWITSRKSVERKVIKIICCININDTTRAFKPIFSFCLLQFFNSHGHFLFGVFLHVGDQDILLEVDAWKFFVSLIQICTEYGGNKSKNMRVCVKEFVSSIIHVFFKRGFVYLSTSKGTTSTTLHITCK